MNKKFDKTIMFIKKDLEISSDQPSEQLSYDEIQMYLDCMYVLKLICMHLYSCFAV